jgi:hypothetical protein
MGVGVEAEMVTRPVTHGGQQDEAEAFFFSISYKCHFL